MIDTLRTFAGYREYPKYALTQRLFIYKQALLKEAGDLVQKGVTAIRRISIFCILRSSERLLLQTGWIIAS